MANERPSSTKRLISAIGLALLVSFALSAVAAGSASASTQYWYSCQYVGWEAGEYSNPECDTVGGLDNYSWVKPTNPISVQMKGQTSFVMRWNAFGIKVKVICTSMETAEGEEATVEDPEGGGAGPLKASFFLSGCYAAFGKSEVECTVKGGALSMSSTVGEPTEFEGVSALKVHPQKGNTLLSFAFGEDCPAYGGQVVNMTGSFTGVFQSDSSLEFSEASSNVLLGGIPVTFEETAKIVKLPKGIPVKLAPAP